MYCRPTTCTAKSVSTLSTSEWNVPMIGGLYWGPSDLSIYFVHLSSTLTPLYSMFSFRWVDMFINSFIKNWLKAVETISTRPEGFAIMQEIVSHKLHTSGWSAPSPGWEGNITLSQTEISSSTTDIFRIHPTIKLTENLSVDRSQNNRIKVEYFILIYFTE